MEMEIDHQRKLVMLWVSRREQEDQSFRTRLQDLRAESKTRKYTVAVFLSGEKELLAQTSALLCDNQRRQMRYGGRVR